MIIYKITNVVNGKVYIGQTSKSIAVRWRGHCCSNHCTALHNAIIKYGKDKFTIEEIDSATTQDELNNKEIYWIKTYNSITPNGYNISTGGNICGMIGVHHTEETKRKISEANKGKILTDEQRKKNKSKKHWK